MNVRLEDIKSQIIWAQAYVVVYSICDVKSFLTAQYYLSIITKIKGITNINVPIVLLGNKRDLEIGRKVGLDEGRSAAIKFGSQFYEVRIFSLDIANFSKNSKLISIDFLHETWKKNHRSLRQKIMSV